MPGFPVVPTPEAWDKLTREVHRLQRDTNNLRNRLATFGVRRHQGGFMPSSNQFALAELDGNLAACDTSSVALNSASVAMTTVNADIYFSTSAGKWTEALTNVPVYNPTPFRYETQDLMWVRKSGTYWIVERPYLYKPFFNFYIATGSCDTSNRMQLTGGTTGSKGSVAAIDGSDNTKLNITAKCNFRYFNVRVQCSAGSNPGTPASFWQSSLSLKINGGSATFIQQFTLDPTTDSQLSSPNTHSHQVLQTSTGDSWPLGMDTYIQLEMDDYLQFELTTEGFANSASFSDLWLTVAPVD